MSDECFLILSEISISNIRRTMQHMEYWLVEK